MDTSELIDNESVITQLNDNLVTLTNFRIRYNDSAWGETHVVSIMLEKISAIEVRYDSFPSLLILGFLMIFTSIGFMAAEVIPQNLMLFLIILGLIPCIIFFLTRKYAIVISSDGGAKISFRAKGMKKELVLKFINQVEGAKQKIK